MGEARRRGRIESAAKNGKSEIKGSTAEIYRAAAEYLIHSAVDRMLLFGPVVWLPSDGTSARSWRFIVAGADRAGKVWRDLIGAETEADTVAMRAGIMLALIEHPPCVAHDFDDELEAAKFAEAAWPGERISRIRESIEAERARWKREAEAKAQAEASEAAP